MTERGADERDQNTKEALWRLAQQLTSQLPPDNAQATLVIQHMLDIQGFIAERISRPKASLASVVPLAAGKPPAGEP